MGRFLLASVVCLLFAASCSELVVQEKISDPAAYNMKFIPQNPGINDEIKLVVYDDCNYNILSRIQQTGKTIDIEKQFNSMMKWPCFMRNDTILIGKLPEGTYTVHYKLMDIAQTPSKTALSLTFNLLVSK